MIVDSGGESPHQAPAVPELHTYGHGINQGVGGFLISDRFRVANHSTGIT
jgi:hypothetical protein